MPLQKYLTTVTNVQLLSENVKLFRLEFDKPFYFQAGQFVILNVTDAEGKPQRRSYSIASSPKYTSFIDLCVKILPDGLVSGVLDNIKVGSTIEIDGPYGKFTIDKEAKKEIILVAAGVGIAPIRSLLFDLHESAYPFPVSLFFGFRFMQDYLFAEDFVSLQKTYPLFTFVPVISRPTEQEKNGMEVGHVNDVLRKYITMPTNKMVYICGSLPMVKDVVASLETVGVTKDHIRTDAWG